MTRETKIGLLVGLAFIIVIGILLSDHMTSTTEPPKAPLSVAGNNVRESIVTPAAPPVAAVGGVATGHGAVAPNQPVSIGGDITQPQRAATPVIHVGPAAAQAQPPVVVQQAQPVQPPQAPLQIPVPQNAVQVTQGPAPVAQAPVLVAPPQPQPQPQVTHPLQRLVSRHGEQLVPVGSAAGANGTGATATSPATVRPQPVPMAPLREYKAQYGDSLSKLAVRFMGSNSKSNRDAIVRVNPTLQQNPDKIVEGRTYVLPPAPAPEADVAAAPAAPAAPAQAPAAAPAGENFSWYTVRENENLWKIASEQLGSGNAWTQIRDLNQDILKGETQLRVNTRIRLPNRPVASVN